MKHRGVICDKCGVEVTLARVRANAWATSTGQPLLAVWFFKGLPSRPPPARYHLRRIERVLYFEAFVIVDAGRKCRICRARRSYRDERKRQLDQEIPASSSA